MRFAEAQNHQGCALGRFDSIFLARADRLCVSDARMQNSSETPRAVLRDETESQTSSQSNEWRSVRDTVGATR
jgi:hypothetical protein